MFEYQIIVHPLGMMYGSGGGFLSPENLIARSASKFPPDAATLAGLFLSANYSNAIKEELKEKLFVAGPFWKKQKAINEIFVPMPRNLVIDKDDWDEWKLKKEGDRPVWYRDKPEVESQYSWQPISFWNKPKVIAKNKKNLKETPWTFTSILHPTMERNQRSVLQKNGLFLENAVQMEPEICLVYLSTHSLEEGWYRFGGENHLVEIECRKLQGDFLNWLKKPIDRAFALITPGVWGSSRFSYRFPKNHADFPEPVRMLTDKPVPYRYSTGGRLGLGRYAVPAGSVYVFDEPLNKTWWDFNPELFPCKKLFETSEGLPKKEGLFKKFGCGLCLPVDIPGL